jgi:hypothetical protein
VQLVVERLYEDETLRADLTDEESEALLSWASQTLIARLDKTFTANGSDTELEAAPDKEFARIKAVVQAIIELTKENTAQPEEPAHPAYTELSFTPLKSETPPELSGFGGLFKGVMQSVQDFLKPLDSNPAEKGEAAGSATADPVFATFEDFGLSHTQVEGMLEMFAGRSRLENINLATELLNPIK